ncbi:hypothetical protein AAY473_010009 [Plecturocebus cupreus]
MCMDQLSYIFINLYVQDHLSSQEILTLSPGLECSGTIWAHGHLRLPDSQSAGITGVSHRTRPLENTFNSSSKSNIGRKIIFSIKNLTKVYQFIHFEKTPFGERDPRWPRSSSSGLWLAVRAQRASGPAVADEF